MDVNSVLHIIIGGLVTLIFFAKKKKKTLVISILILLAFGKETYDHFYVLGHCLPGCLGEHISDFFLSLIFFICYILVLYFSKKMPSQINYKHYIIILILVVLTSLSFKGLIDKYKKIGIMTATTGCK